MRGNSVAAFAIRAERYDQAIDAYQHVIELEPADPAAYLGAAAAMLKVRKLDDARAQAELAVSVAGERDARSRAAAHELLARIALARHDAEGARREAGLARESDPKLPLPAYIEARLLYDQGKYAEALALFEQAIAELKRSGDRTIADLHFYTADALVHLERSPEAEREFIEELKVSPQNTRARAGLATLYHANGQSEDVTRVLDDLVKISPTPDAYALAARLWTTFGNRQQADAVRAQARRTVQARQPASRAPPHSSADIRRNQIRGRPSIPHHMIAIVGTIRVRDRQVSGRAHARGRQLEQRVVREQQAARAQHRLDVGQRQSTDPGCRSTRTRWWPPRDRTEDRRTARATMSRFSGVTRSAIRGRIRSVRISTVLPTAAGFASRVSTPIRSPSCFQYSTRSGFHAIPGSSGRWISTVTRSAPALEPASDDR